MKSITRHIFIILLMLFQCGINIRLSKSSLDEKFDKIIKNVNRNFDYLPKLGEIRAGETGYFYVIDYNGRIAYHPQKAIIGMSFIDNPFVKEVLKLKEGCLNHFVEKRNTSVIFKQINSRLTLCLSIDNSEVDSGSLECVDFNKE